MSEEWREIPGHSGYEVSNKGRVRSLSRTQQVRSRWGASFTRIFKGQVLRPYRTRRGYLEVHLTNRVRRNVHLLVAEAFHGPRPANLEACHNDGNRLNNRADNLRWGTSSENKVDTVEHGTHVQARKSVCPRGHALSGTNLRKGDLRLGRRSCLSCGHAHGVASDLRKRGQDLDAAEFKAIADAKYADLATRQTTVDTPGPGYWQSRRRRRRR